MNNSSGYYLHENGSLIHKTYINHEDMSDSDLVLGYWYDSDIGASPNTFLTFLKEAKSLGANQSELLRLINHNRLDKYISNCLEQIGV